MTLVVSTLVEAEAWEKWPDLEVLAHRVMDGGVGETGVKLAPEAEVSLLLGDDARIREINHQWRHLDKPTNVLSFPAVPPAGLARAPLLGDIAIAFETVAREAEEEAKTFRDHFAHMALHGFLHLLGYDHETDEEADEMEAMEIRTLAQLGIADPYAFSELDQPEA